ncbi:MAG TPA: hypothetical protein VG676_04620 [Chitinophagaceae bacterium]|mgnify:CR=1 FL=1|jgi:cbb3-type cytochrome oxidase subunit 3|nr:hypothetical protein [Chitinophagaceae bacterium]
MNNKTDINPKTEEILNSLDGIRQATAQPFLYTRVMARLTKETTSTRWEKIASLFSKPAFAIATIALFLLINAAVVFHFSTKATTTQDESAVVSDNEYNLSVSSLYDLNPEQNDIAQK